MQNNNVHNVHNNFDKIKAYIDLMKENRVTKLVDQAAGISLEIDHFDILNEITVPRASEKPPFLDSYDDILFHSAPPTEDINE